MKTVIAHSPEHEAIEFLGVDAPPHDPIRVDYGPKRPGGALHEYRCAVCGHTNHCSACRRGHSSSYLGHGRQDDVTGEQFYICQDPDRWAGIEARRRATTEKKERTELRRLAAKYPDEIGFVDAEALVKLLGITVEVGEVHTAEIERDRFALTVHVNGQRWEDGRGA